MDFLLPPNNIKGFTFPPKASSPYIKPTWYAKYRRPVHILSILNRNVPLFQKGNSSTIFSLKQLPWSLNAIFVVLLLRINSRKA